MYSLRIADPFIRLAWRYSPAEGCLSPFWSPARKFRGLVCRDLLTHPDVPRSITYMHYPDTFDDFSPRRVSRCVSVVRHVPFRGTCKGSTVSWRLMQISRVRFRRWVTAIISELGMHCTLSSLSAKPRTLDLRLKVLLVDRVNYILGTGELVDEPGLLH